METERPPAIVFLPGMGQMPTDWQSQVASLPPGWRGFVPWLPGLKPTDKQGFDLERAVGEMVMLLIPTTSLGPTWSGCRWERWWRCAWLLGIPSEWTGWCSPAVR